MAGHELQSRESVSLRHIFALWAPLGISWLFTGIEMPALSAAIARMPFPEINLAAYGGIVFPLALIIEAPVIMLLGASTALSRDWASFARMRRFMIITALLLTGLHILVAFTPLYYLVVEGILAAPPEIVEPARPGLMIMLPWTFMVAYRRFHQGVLIRFGHSHIVGRGSLLRLCADIIVLVLAALSGSMTGVMAGAAAQAAGVTVEAAYIGMRVKPILKGELRAAPAVESLTWRAFFNFYTPLALTSFLTFLWGFIASAAISRMHLALQSLAVFQVLGSGLSFLMRTPGIAYQEAVVALIDKQRSSAALRRFTHILSLSTISLQLLLLVTPLAYLWFNAVSGLSTSLSEMGVLGFWLLLPTPALVVYQSWFQGILLHGRKTRGIPESIVVFLLSAVLVLSSGAIFRSTPGLYITMAAYTAASLAQTGWVWLRARPVMRMIEARDSLA